MAERYDAVVVGAGVVGSSCALHLLEGGMESVLVLEADQPASKASGRAAGHLRTYTSGKFDPRIVAYCGEFYDDLADRHANVELRTDRDFVLSHTAEGATALERHHAESSAPLRALSTEERLAEAPALDGPDVSGTLLFADAVHTDPYSVTVATLADARDLGATVRLERVTDLDAAGGEVAVETTDATYRSPLVVAATGAWTPALLSTLDLAVPLRPRTSQIAILEPPDPIEFPMFHAPDLGLYGRQEESGDVLVGGGSTTPIPDPDSFSTRARESFLQYVAGTVGEVSTALSEAELVNDWAGRCSATPDRNPLIGATAVRGLYVCAGFNGGGVARAPFAGRLLADLALDREPTFDPTPFDPARFTGEEQFEIKSASTNW
jgi:sarcosine oxidase subunit beta